MALNWTETAIAGAGLWDQLDRYDELNRYTQSEMSRLSGQAVEGSRFTPFGVAGYGGGATVGGDGSVNVSLNPEQQAQADMLTGAAGQFFQRASGPTAEREQSIFDMVREMQRPDEERAMLGLEGRALAQGRLGMQANEYGGSSPEMLAMQTAIGENRNKAAFTAIEQARAQQAQDATIGLDFQNAAYLPQAQSLNLLNQGMQGANMVQAGQLGGLNLATQLGLGGVQTQVNSERIRGELLSNLFTTIGGQFTGTQPDPLGDLFGNIFGGMFGGRE